MGVEGTGVELRPLGDTGIRVSSIGLGTVKLGRAEGVKYPNAFTIPSDEEADRLIGAALELGVNLIDTAPAYGTSEERLGRLLSGRRDRVVLATKAGEVFAAGASTFDFGGAAIVASVERSLARLGTDRLDVVLIHSDGVVELDADRMDAAVGALERLKRAGKVRAIGASTKSPGGAMRLLSGGVPSVDVLMLTLNAAYTADVPVIEEAARRGVGVLIKKGLASGHAAVGPGGTGGAGGDPVRVAIGLALARPGVSSVVVGTINPEHLEANIRAAEAVG